MTREFKRIDELTKIDELHVLLGQITGGTLNLEALYKAVASIELHKGVPEDIRGQFNVARNMALYTYYFYALAPEAQLKTFTVIELALRKRDGNTKKKPLKALLEKAVASGLIDDAGFRHISEPKPDNAYSHNLCNTLPHLRNALAHGSTRLTPDVVWYLQRCADLVNQLWPQPPREEAPAAA